MTSFYRLSSVLLCTLSIAVVTIAAHAELLDLSASTPVIQPVNQNASWLIMPNFRYESRFSDCLDNETGEVVTTNKARRFNMVLGFFIDKKGEIMKVEVVKSSGNRCIDNRVMRQSKRGQFTPFVRNGKPEVGHVTLPMVFEVPYY